MKDKIRLHNFHINNPEGVHSGRAMLFAATQVKEYLEAPDIKIAINMCFFLENVPYIKFEQENRRKINDLNPVFFQAWRDVFRDTPHICHIAACGIAAHCELEYVLGFIVQNIPEHNTSVTILHSFNVYPQEDHFVDFQLEAMISSEKKDIEKSDWDSVSTYEGVVFPVTIVKDVFDLLHGNDKHPDMISFLKQYVFSSFKKTEKFIAIINSNGESWDIKDFVS